MAVPVVPALLGRTAAVTGTVAVAQAVSVGISPFTRGWQYGANRERPNLAPDVLDVWGAYWGGWITDVALRDYLTKSHGVVVNNRSDDEYHRGWGNILGWKRPELPLQMTISAWHEGIVDDRYLELVLSKDSLSEPHQIEAVKRALPAYPESFIFQQHHLGFFGAQWGPAEMRRLGYAQGERWKPLLQSYKPLDITVAVPMFLRGYIDDQEFSRHVSAEGYPNQVLNQGIRQLAYGIPGPSDLVRFAVREVWNDDIVRAFGYDAEFPPPFREWMKRQGFDYNVRDVFPNLPEGNWIEWSRAYWRAHWDVMSPTQGYVALHRLRGDPQRAETWRVPGTRPFTRPDMEKLLQIGDYPPPMREWLIGISYNVIGRIDLRRLYARGVFGAPGGANAVKLGPDNMLVQAGPAEREVYERYQDMGYAPREAALLTAWQAADAERTLQTPVRSKTVNLICEAFRLGAVGRDEAQKRLGRAGVEAKVAKAVLDNCELRRFLDDLKIATTNIKKGYIQGKLTREEATGELAAIGIAPAAVNQHMQHWDAVRRLRGKEATAAQMCQWYQEGLLTLEEMGDRLRKLDWSREDVTRIQRHCVLGILGRQAKERSRLIVAQQREQQRRVTLAEKRARAIASEQQRLGTRALAGRTEKNLSAWLRSRLITAPEVRATLVAKGWPPADIERWLAVYGEVINGITIPTTPQRVPRRGGQSSTGGQPGDGTTTNGDAGQTQS